MNLEEAQDINKYVRKKFGEGGKSSNKFYVAEGEQPEDATIENFVKKGDPLFTKAGRRNTNASIVSGDLINLREKIMKSCKNALEYGKFIDSDPRICGNCTEMAALAAYCVSLDEKTTPISIVATADVGDHVFTVVGKISGWKLIGKPAGAEDLIVIDPWANVCCFAHDYPAKLMTTATKWQQSGKRIAGAYFDILPAVTFAEKVLLSETDIIDARKNIPNFG
ncbi:hypothetical protein [Azospirillum endophyticum]